MRKRRLRRLRRRRRIRRLVIAGIILLVIFGIIKNKNRDDMLNLEDCPESLVSLYENNPEARNFVLDYEKKADKHKPIDISGEVRKGEIPLFLQWDERWGYESYGDDFMALTGCGPTCLSMVYCGLTGDTVWDPYELAKRAEEEGYYVDGSGSSWSIMTGLAETLGLDVEQMAFNQQQILSSLQEGDPIICIMGPGDFTSSGHFIVLSGVSGDGRIEVRDPNSKKNSEKLWDLDTIMDQAKNLWCYYS